MLTANAIGFDEVENNLKTIQVKADKALQDELVRSGYRVKSESERTLTRESKVATGALRSSARVIQRPGNVKVEYNAKYASVVEFGRRAGKFPPLQPMEDWVKKRGLADDPKEIKQVAFLVSRKIARNGIKPTPYLVPAFRKEALRLKTRLKGIIK